MYNTKCDSNIINNFEKEIRNEDTLRAFWNKIEDLGTPVIESLKDSDDSCLLTYIYKGDENTRNVVVMHPTCWKDYKDNMLINIKDTNVWYKSYIIRNDVRGRYDFSVNDALDDDWEKRSANIIHDVYNKNKIIFKDDEGKDESVVSYFSMPKAEKYVWTIDKMLVNKGLIETHEVYLKGLDNNRKIYVYKPFNYSQNNNYKLLVLTDGDTYINMLSAQSVIDNLIGEGAIEPIIVVFIHGGGNRNEELMCNETFVDSLALDIMPWVKTNFNISDKPEDIIIGGFSLGGLFAAYVGLKYPNIFGNVLSQSGSFFWSANAPKETNWIISKYKEAEVLPMKFFINVGVLENMDYPPYSSMIDINKEMRDVLIERKNTIVKYEEFKSGHDYLSWGETLSNGLMFLLGN